MYIIIRYGLLFWLAMIFMPSLSANAMPAITCHCFTNRLYDAAHPAAADGYFLATVQNSFFAITFNTNKKAVVMKKQQGASAEDLWVAYWIAAQSGISPETLLKAKRSKDTWQAVLASLPVYPKNLGARFLNALTPFAPAARLSEAVVDELVIKHILLRSEDLVALRKSGATNQELILSTIVSVRLKQSARQLYSEVKSGTATWGSLLSRGNMNPKEMQDEIAQILKSNR